MNNNINGYIKKFNFPASFVAPTNLKFKDLVARPLTRQDLADDLHAVNSSIETIQKTRGGSWPTEELTEDFDLLDLAWHEREFRDSSSFAYVVYDENEKYVGCFYLYPMGVRTKLTDDLLNYDMDASWWVTKEAYDKGNYKTLFNALKQWLPNEFPTKSIYYSNKEIPA